MLEQASAGCRMAHDLLVTRCRGTEWRLCDVTFETKGALCRESQAFLMPPGALPRNHLCGQGEACPLWHGMCS
jgi:hypothetical protein